LREYEFTYVIQPEITDEGITAICQRFEGLLAENDSEKLYYEDWGRRRLAYEIKSFQKGHYLVLHFLSEGKVVPELERAARLDDSILRFMTVQVDDDVRDIEARRAEGKTLEEEREKRAAERAARDAEDAAREQAERAEAERAEAERAKKRAAEAMDGDSGDADGEDDSDGSDDDSDDSGDDDAEDSE
jgi:small subunit ribosomal protein S6